jgi:hypothetical protein
LDNYDAFEHLISALRQAARAGNQTVALAVVSEIEARVRPRLSGVEPPPSPDVFEEWAYAQAGKPMPKPEWDLTRAEGQHGVGHLQDALRKGFEKARLGVGLKRSERPALRWYPAARVLRYCLAVREYGATDRTVEWLSDALRALPAYEQAIGTKVRVGRGPRGPSAASRAIVEEMAVRVSKGSSVSEAALHVYKRGLGSSPEGNRKAWGRRRKKLGQ